jgi:uncharacterized protein (DUF58 family)
VEREGGGLDIVLAVDTSGSMRESLRASVAAVRLFLKNVGSEDRVALVGFSDRPKVLQPSPGIPKPSRRSWTLWIGPSPMAAPPSMTRW